MVVRRTIGVVGVLLLLVGLFEIAFPGRAISLTKAVAHLVWLRITGGIGAAVGVVLLIAYFNRLVGLRLFVLILGIYMIAAGLIALAGPELMRDLIYALLLRRAPAFQLVVLWVSGLVRIALGIALLYSVARPQRPAEQSVS